MKQQTTIDTTHATPNVTRTTGPLAQSIIESVQCIEPPSIYLVPQGVNDPYSMVVPVMSNDERVTVPGVLLDDPEFAGGYACGRALYSDAVNAIVDQAGNIVERVLVSQLPFVKPVKVRDITDQDAITFIAETLAWECDEWTGEPIPLACRAGIIFGYIHACVQSAQVTQDDGFSLPDGFPNHVTVDMGRHRAEVQDEGFLTIEAKGYPIPLVHLESQETEQLLETLLIAKYGLHPCPNQEASA